ncbi:hypothetical protein KBC79_02110 [Candidatus Woesebacteria bacterium]|nr:hypothetical protein [Candidatus Woesebacteria bacterium]
MIPFKLPQEAVVEFIELVNDKYSQYGLTYDESLAEEHATRFFLGFESFIKTNHFRQSKY